MILITLFAGLVIEALVLLFLVAIIGIMFEASTASRWMSRENPKWRVRWPGWINKPWEIAFYGVLAISLATIGVLYGIGRIDWLVIAGGLATFIVGIVGMYAPKETRIREIAPELVGIAIGVMAIDQLYQIRLEQQEKRAIIRQLGSLSNEFALESVRLSRERGWLRDGSLENVHLFDANLQGAPLARAYLRRADLHNAKLQGADLHDANLQEADLYDANLQGANLFLANLKGATLVDANLQGVDLRWADLEGTRLRGANLQGAKLRRAKLQGADLSLVDLKGADLNLVDLERATYTYETSWPDAFDPKTYGAILIDVRGSPINDPASGQPQ